MKEYTLQDAKDEVSLKRGNCYFIMFQVRYQKHAVISVMDEAAELYASKVTEELRKENEALKLSLSTLERFRIEDAASAIDDHNDTRTRLKSEIERLKESNIKLEEWKRQSIEVMGDTLKLLIKLRK